MTRYTVLTRLLAQAGVVVGLAGCDAAPAGPARPRKIYVSAHDVSRIDVLDGRTLAPLVTLEAGFRRMPHDLVLTPDQQRVLVANPSLDGETPDEVLVIDVATDTIVARVPLEAGAFIDHVLPSPDGTQVFVSGWGSNRIHRFDLATLARLPDFLMTGIASPKGLQLSADGALLYTANAAGTVSEIDARSGGVLREFTLGGPAVQVAVGASYVYASVFQPPAVARIDRATGVVTGYPLPGARGMGQIVLSADERTVYAADEGARATPGNQLYVLDADTGVVLAQHEVGLGANAVALSPDGALAYVTGMFDASLAVVDLSGATATALGGTNRGPNAVALLWDPAP